MNRNQILTAMLCIAMSISHIACDKKDTSDQDVPSQEGMSSDSPDRPETEVEISPTQTPDDDSGDGQGAGATKGRIEWVFEDGKWVPKQIE